MPNFNTTKRNDFAFNEDGHPLYGLKTLRNRLERIFFASCHTNWSFDDCQNTTNLVISLHCNFGLTECLFHMNRGTWGGFVPNGSDASKFDKTLQLLTEENQTTIDISELSINFNDTTLCISKIYPQSIPDYLDAILTSISANFVHFTKALTEMPFEIFVPVFKEPTKFSQLDHLREKSQIPKNYFDYWGLYFDSSKNNDATIYDVKHKTTIEGEFFLLDF